MTTSPLSISLQSNDFATDELRIRQMTMREAISKLYEIDLELVHLDSDGFDLEQVAGAEVDVVFSQDGAELRRIHGMIVCVDDMADPEAEHRQYRIRVLPRAHRWSLVAMPEVFLAMGVPAVLAAKAGAVGLDEDVEFRLAETYPEREFAAQYDEDDISFVSRTAEHVGISYFFEQRDGIDFLVFTDFNEGFADLGEIAFRGRGEKRGIHRLEVQRNVVSSTRVVRDYNYRLPTIDLTAAEKVPGGFAGGVVEHGTHHQKPGEAAFFARIRSEESACRMLTYSGESAQPDLTAGARMTIPEHPRLGTLHLLITEVEHRATQAIGGNAGEAKPSYANSFKAVPADRPFRPKRTTKKPRIAGLVHGIIEMDPGADPTIARLDDQGRYLVRFLFDLAASDGRAPSHRIRMAQPHAGIGYGMHLPLKPGTEVVIAFTEGDPDRPVIVGAVPNPVTPSPVNASNPYTHRIRTQTGIVFDLVDGQ